MSNIEYQDPDTYSLETPIRMAIYSYNGVGKTTFIGKAAEAGMRVIHLDCGDAGAISLRKFPNVKIVRIQSTSHFLDVANDIITKADKFDLVVPDTLTGLQSKAVKETKGKKSNMDLRKWGIVGSKVIECISEINLFPKDIIYLVQERKRKDSDESTVDTTSPSLTPSVKGYLSGVVDWVGWLSIGEEGKRYLDFRITETLEAKDRATLFPKRIANPNYVSIRNRIIRELKGAEE